MNLGSIFRKHLEAIPSSFKHTDPRTVLYQRSKPISSTIVNYKQVVDNVNTDDWKYNNNHTCDCENRVITNKKLRSLLMKGPGYRESKKINWGKFLIAFKTSLNDCVNKWADSENVDSCFLDEWKNEVFDDVKSKVQKLNKVYRRHTKSILTNPIINKYVNSTLTLTNMSTQP